MNLEFRKNILILVGIAIILIVIYFFSLKKQNINSSFDILVKESVEDDLNFSLLLSKKCPFDEMPNVQRTGCEIFLLDKISAEREWKMIKLENLTEKDVNISEIMGDLKEQSQRIKDWRLGFDDIRDKWCITEENYYGGSGTPSAVATCKLNLELLALQQLNNLHLKLVELTGSNKINNFEPTDEQLLSIMNTNKIYSSDCSWHNEDNCNYKYTLENLKEFRKK